MYIIRHISTSYKKSDIRFELTKRSIFPIKGRNFGTLLKQLRSFFVDFS